jgi:hypothetical protein
LSFREQGLNDILEGGAEGWWKGEQGIATALTGGLLRKESSLLGENYLGLVDTSAPYVNQGVWGGRAYTAATAAAGMASNIGPVINSTLVDSKLFGRASWLFGRSRYGNQGVLNQCAFRTGWGWKGAAKTGQDVFRTSLVKSQKQFFREIFVSSGLVLIK